MFWSSKPRVITDPARIDEVLTRSVAAVLPSREALKKELMSGKRLKIYIGVDATGTELHIGHATNFILLEKLRQLGHDVVVLFGDFTALIGDPSGHSAAREQLTEEEVRSNIATWRLQVEKVLALSDHENPAAILQNSAWLSRLTFQDVIKLAAHFTVQHMLERDLFERRLAEKKPLYLHEFLYPVMQGYDSVAMDVDVEVGGTDQTFNMLAGRLLQQRLRRREKFIIATTLLEHPKTKEKLMSKSLGTVIALSDPPRDMFGKTMALPDDVVRQVFVCCTLLPLDRIESELEKHPREAKLSLATELVRLYHGEAAARAAREHFVRVFSQSKSPTETFLVEAESGTPVSAALLSAGVVASKTQWRRLVSGGAVEKDGAKVTDAAEAVSTGSAVYRVGKHRFVEVRGK